MEEVWVESRGSRTHRPGLSGPRALAPSLLLTDLDLTITHPPLLGASILTASVSSPPSTLKYKTQVLSLSSEEIKNRRDELRGNHYTRVVLYHSIL